jgi:hypothetical protein
MVSVDPDKEPVPELFDQDSIDRIIAATKLPLCTDLKVFQRDLVECYKHWHLWSAFGPRAAKKGIARLAKLRRWAADGVRLLKEDDADHAHIQALWDAHGDGYPPLLPQLERFGALLERVNLDSVKHVGSPLELLTGVLLPQVFAYHFKRKARISRDHSTEQAGGPYVRFAEQVCTEFGIECSRETIVSALKRLSR